MAECSFIVRNSLKLNFRRRIARCSSSQLSCWTRFAISYQGMRRSVHVTISLSSKKFQGVKLGARTVCNVPTSDAYHHGSDKTRGPLVYYNNTSKLPIKSPLLIAISTFTRLLIVSPRCAVCSCVSRKIGKYSVRHRRQKMETACCRS